MTQKDAILRYLKETGSITRAEAFTELGIAELSSRIGELEMQGYEFDRTRLYGKNRYGEPIHYIKYSLKGECR